MGDSRRGRADPAARGGTQDTDGSVWQTVTGVIGDTLVVHTLRGSHVHCFE